MDFFRNLRAVTALMLALFLAGPAIASISSMPCHQVVSLTDIANEIDLATEIAVSATASENSDSSKEHSRCSACAACSVGLALVTHDSSFVFEKIEHLLIDWVVAPHSDSPCQSLYRPPKV